MGKNILIISASFRENSNSEALADAFAEGARSAGHDVRKISLCGKEMAFCHGCFACLKTGRCVIADDAPEITAAMHDADVIAFATPIYYYEMSGQLKTLLDRSNSLFDSDYAFTDIYFFAAAAEEGEAVFSRAKAGIEGWIECFERSHLAGTAFAGGFNEAERAAGSPALDEARRLGAGIK